jgi:predicted dehydrogenase
MIALSKPLNVAVVGCGAVSQLYYTPALKELEKLNWLRVKALVDPNAQNMAQLQKAFPDAMSVKNLEELSKLDITLAIIASPPHLHAVQTITMLKAGLSVLCEKPMATTTAQGEAMIEAATTENRVLAIGLFRRFFPATQTIRQILEQHLLGEIKDVYCYEGGNFRWPVQSASFFHKKTAGGGVLMDIGVHLLDLLIWWWGYPLEAFYQDDAMGGIEANCYLELKFSQGFVIQVRLSRDWSLPNRYIIQGTKGWLSWNVNDADKVQIGFNNSGFALDGQLFQTKPDSLYPALDQPAVNFQQSFVNQLRNVIAAIHGSEQLLVPGEQGLQSLKLIDYCYQHRNLMPMPWLSSQEFSRARQLSDWL